MSGLRFFEREMHALIEADRRNAAVAARAATYAAQCRTIRDANLPVTDRPSADFHRASEGLCAARIIAGLPHG